MCSLSLPPFQISFCSNNSICIKYYCPTGTYLSKCGKNNYDLIYENMKLLRMENREINWSGVRCPLRKEKGGVVFTRQVGYCSQVLFLLFVLPLSLLSSTLYRYLELSLAAAQDCPNPLHREQCCCHFLPVHGTARRWA